MDLFKPDALSFSRRKDDRIQDPAPVRASDDQPTTGVYPGADRLAVPSPWLSQAGNI
jgi:hypothetical protein